MFDETLKAAESGDVEAQVALSKMYQEGNEVPQNDKKAVKWANLAAKQGNAEAQELLARDYAMGKGVNKDPKMAYQWCMKAVEQGFLNAYLLMSHFSFEGIGVDKNEEEGVKWGLQAAQKGHANAQDIVARWYKNGVHGVEQNDEKAVEWWTKAMEGGNIAAKANLGMQYLSGEGIQKDVEKGLAMLHEAAEAGEMESYAWLMQAYMKGIGVEENGEIAMKWAQKAADSGDELAMFFLAGFYYTGYWCEQSFEKSFMFAQLAAKKGVEEALFLLGLFYFDGNLVKKNRAFAHELWDEAEQRGLPIPPFVQTRLDMEEEEEAQIEKWISDEDKDWIDDDDDEILEEPPFEDLLKMAEEGDIEAMKEVANCYELGDSESGIEVDPTKSFFWAQKAAQAGDMDSRVDVAVSTFYGEGCKQNVEEGLRLLQELSKEGSEYATNVLLDAYIMGEEGVEINFEEALRWGTQAADAGLSVISARIGLWYHRGEGLKRNPVLAVKYLKQALEKRNDSSIEVALAKEYIWGEGIEKDTKKGVELLEKHADNDVLGAALFLGNLYLKGTDVPASGRTAEKYLRIASKKGNTGADVSLAKLYREGTLVKKNRTKAERLLAKAREADFDVEAYLQDEFGNRGEETETSR